MHGDRTRSSVRRIAIRGAFLVVPLVALALGVPHVISSCRRGEDTGGLGIIGAEKTDERPTDRPPSSRERAAASSAAKKLADAQQVWKDSTAIPPSEAKPDSSGERVRWFLGFGVSVESRPTGAQVIVDGRDVGRTPIVASVRCDPGDEVHVEVRKPGRRSAERTTKCREDQLVELRFDLQ